MAAAPADSASLTGSTCPAGACSGPRRISEPQMIAPPRKIAAHHQNTVV